jgi:predicted metal-binding membrane protein
MTASAPAATRRAPRSVSLWGHPETWVYALAAVAWINLAGLHLDAAGPPHAHHASAAVSHHHSTATWLLMVAAMMLPIAAPGARYLARAGFWRRRHVTTVLYVTGFSAIWAAFALALRLAQATLGVPGRGPAWIAALAAAAAAWQSSRVRRQLLTRCSVAPALPQRGWRATSRTIQAGARSGGFSIATCGAAMSVMVASDRLALMAVLFAVQTYERRRGPNPFAERRWQAPAAAYALLAAGAAAVAVI